MKNKLLMILVAMMVLISTMALADISAVTITAPASNGLYLKNNYVFTGTYTGSSSQNITVLYNETGGGTGLFICADTTVTTPNSTWTCTGTISQLDQCTAHTLVVGAINASGIPSATANRTSIKGDGTDPDVGNYVIFNDITITQDGVNFPHKLYTSLDYSASPTDNCGIASYAVTATKPSGTVVTKTSASGTFPASDFDELGDYSMVYSVTDNAGNTAETSGANIIANVKSKNRDAEQSVIDQVTQTGGSKPNNNMILGMGAAVLVLLLIAAGIVASRSTGKKRRR